MFCALASYRLPLTIKRQHLFNLTGVNWNVRVVYGVVFTYKNQVIFNMTVFDGGPRWHMLTIVCGIYTKKSFLEGGLGVRGRLKTMKRFFFFFL